MRDWLLHAHPRFLAGLPFGLLAAMASMLGWWSYITCSRECRIARTNIDLCYNDLGKRERERLVRRSLREMNKSFLEMPRIWRTDRTTLKKLVTAHKGLDMFRRGKKYGKGIIVAVPYLGNWEVMAYFLSTMGEACAVDAATPLKKHDALIFDGRLTTGVNLVGDADEEAYVEVLQSGGIACIFSDSEPEEEEQGVFAPLFNTPAFTTTLVHRLARRTGSVVIFAFAERRRKGRGYRIHWILGPEEIYDADSIASATAVNRAVKACVKRNPYQYFWSNERYSRQLDGKENPYALL